MSQTFVAFDLETTGLDPKTDAIIEIGMVRFDETGILEEFSTLVNPGMTVSEEIENITGITNADVATAPVFGDVREKVSRFFGNSAIVAHNADFDMAFLAQRGFDFSLNGVVDTFRLAQMAFMGERSMNLSGLADAAGHSHEGAHRALSDARATVSVFQECFRRIAASEGVLRTAYRFLRSAVPNLSTFEVAGAAAFSGNAEPSASAFELFACLAKEIPEYEDLPRMEKPKTFPNAVDILSSDPALEKRGEQWKMAALVEAAFAEKKHVAIEAPTGIGKTFAYMVPAVISAVRNGEKVTISTNTKTLQDQIEKKDVPRIREMLAPSGLSGFRFSKLKGRSNYASLLKLSEFSERESFTEEEALFFAKVCTYLSKNPSGELDDLPVFGKDYELISEIHSGDSRVLSPDNSYRKQEFLFKAREAVKTADVILVNHALLLTEIGDDAPGSIGKLSRLVVDEAHNLEAAATDALLRTFALADAEKTFSHIEASIRRHNRTPAVEKFLFPELREISDSFVLSFGMALELSERYAFSKAGSSPRSEYGKGRSTDILVTADFFTFEGVSSADTLVASLLEKIKDLSDRLHGAPEKLFEAFETPLSELSAFAVFLEEFFSSSRNDLIKIISLRDSGDCRLKIAPLDVSKVLSEKLWSRLDACVLTSATLTIGNTFDFLKKSLALGNFEFHILDSDFDYSKQAMVFLPTDFGDIRNESDRIRVNEFVQDAILAVGGRTLGLFTSFVSIREAYLQINANLRNAGIKLLTQGLSGGKHKMIEEFKRDSHRSALFWTDSFWEGVDIPGKDLEMLFIYKFPFAVPTDPVVMARSKLYRDPFAEYSLPQMLLKLRQGIGRLIRTKEDRGIIVILDSRVRSAWGEAVSKAYPGGIRIRSGESAVFIDMLKKKRSLGSVEA